MIGSFPSYTQCLSTNACLRRDRFSRSSIATFSRKLWRMDNSRTSPRQLSTIFCRGRRFTIIWDFGEAKIFLKAARLECLPYNPRDHRSRLRTKITDCCESNGKNLCWDRSREINSEIRSWYLFAISISSWPRDGLTLVVKIHEILMFYFEIQ